MLWKKFGPKHIGIIPITATETLQEDVAVLDGYIKILLLHPKSSLSIDFTSIAISQQSLFFIAPHQVFKLTPNKHLSGWMIYYNRDFYCVQIHDREVSCDGILYNNVYTTPQVALSSNDATWLQATLDAMKAEMPIEDVGNEEMLRILLKQVIIKSTRLWKQQHQMEDKEMHQQVDFVRKFSMLVEQHYKTLHTVADYADLLHVTAKNLHKKISLVSPLTPNELIKERILLEAKRLLAHTNLSVKEIGYELGYADDAYFVRFFSKQAGLSPNAFRKQY